MENKDIITTLSIELTEEERKTLKGLIEYHTRNAKEEIGHVTSSEEDTFRKEIKLLHKIDMQLD